LSREKYSEVNMKVEDKANDKAVPHEHLRYGTVDEAMVELDKQLQKLRYESWRLHIENIVVRRKMAADESVCVE